MRSRLFFFFSALFVIAIVLSGLLQQALVQAPSQRFGSLVPFQSAQRQVLLPSPSANSPLQPVNAQTLVGHMTALSYPRMDDADRAVARSYIRQVLTDLGWQVREQPFANHGINVIADRPGTDTTPGIILLGAHYDTVPNSPGADDNATGIAIILEAARILGRYPTPKTLRLAFFDHEELGLLGSIAFVEQPENIQHLQGAFIMDMVGYACYQEGCQSFPAGLARFMPTTKGDFLAAIGDQEHETLLQALIPPDQGQSLAIRGILKPIYQPAKTMSPAIVTLPIPLKGVLTPDLLRSDHAPFWQRQIGAVLLTDTANFRSPHYHQPTDTPTTVDQDFFTRSAQLIINATTTLLQQSH